MNEYRGPGESDRKPVRSRIAAALADGRISSADAEIRLTNVANAQSLTELSLITRDLDQIEAAASAAERAAGAVASPPGDPLPSISPTPVSAGSSGRLVPLLILGFVVALVVAGGIVVVLVNSSSEQQARGSVTANVDPAEAPPSPVTPVTPGSPGSPGSPAPGLSTNQPTADGEPAVPAPEGPPAFELSATGIASFLSLYEQRFSTNLVVEMTMYDDYVVVRVPVPGKNRYSGWLYRDGEWTDFGGVAANFPGSEPVNLRKLDVAALIRNIAKARRSLNVEDYSTTYVTLNYRPQFDASPNANIYVANEFRESGYLATTLSGKVERAFPYEG